MIIPPTIDVTVKHTNNVKQALYYLKNTPDLFAADFETCIRYTDEEVEHAKKMLTKNLTPQEKNLYASISVANALMHPSHCFITHLSVAWEKDKAYVIIIDNDEMADAVLDFLTTTEKTQVWHNYCYDGRFIRYFTGKDAKNVEDTQILSKCFLNHVDIHKAKTSLKELMGHVYGSWAIAPNNFTFEKRYENTTIKYSGVDAAATYHLWCDTQEHIQEVKNG